MLITKFLCIIIFINSCGAEEYEPEENYDSEENHESDEIYGSKENHENYGSKENHESEESHESEENRESGKNHENKKNHGNRQYRHPHRMYHLILCTVRVRPVFIFTGLVVNVDARFLSGSKGLKHTYHGIPGCGVFKGGIQN